MAIEIDPSGQTRTVAYVPTNQTERNRWFTAIVGMLVAIGFALVAGVSYWWSGQAVAIPQEGAAEVGFARDMATHHAQAVDMATLLRDRTSDAEMRILALDIMLTQQAQIGQMQGWLAVWGQPNVGTAPTMAWAGMPTTGPMPGMANAAELNRLRTLTGVTADGLFLQLMIAHHRAGVAMAQAVLARTQRPEVRALAQAIVNSQQSEITYMQALRQRKGLPPVPTMPAMNQSDMTH